MTLMSRLNGRDIFDSLKPEEEQPKDRRLEVLRLDIKEGLDQIIETLKDQDYMKGIDSIRSPLGSTNYPISKIDCDLSRQEKVYQLCLDSISRAYDSKEIARFFNFEANTFAQTLDRDNLSSYLAVLGLYASALINTSKDEKHYLEIPTAPSERISHDFIDLSCLGYRNVKDVCIEGGNIPLENLAILMQDGNLSIDNIGTGLINGKGLVISRRIGTLMCGGTINIGRNVGNHLALGEYMSGGTIRSALGVDYAGHGMTGGEIEVPKLKGIGHHISGGVINVEEVGGDLGWGMRGGTINVSKHIGRPYVKVLSICKDMRGGEIRIKESTDLRISKTARKGEIYYADRLLWKDGVMQ